MENLKKKLMRIVTLCLAAVLAAGCLAGCGAGDKGGNDDDKAKAVVENFVEAKMDSDAEAIVDLLPDAYFKKVGEEEGLTESESKDYMEEMFSYALSWIEDEREGFEYNIGKVRDANDDELESVANAYKELNVDIEGLKYVEIESDGETDEMGIVKIDGKWYLDFYGMNGL